MDPWFARPLELITTVASRYRWSTKHGEAKQLELIGMTSVAEIQSADTYIGRAAVAPSAESAADEVAGAAPFETEE